MVFGVMGGQYQAAGHVHFLSNILDFGMDLQEAIDAPRVFATPEGLWIEDNLDDATRKELSDLGHKLVRRKPPIGGAQAIRIDRERGLLIGASDPRKDGVALGY